MIGLIQVFFNSLKANQKAQILSNVKTKGQSVLDMMDKNIRNADNIVCAPKISGQNYSKIIVIVKDKQFTRYRLFNTGDSDSTCRPDLIGGHIQQDHPVLENNDNIETTCVTDAYATCAEPNSKIFLIDPDRDKMSVSDGKFILPESSGFADVVTIKFKLNTIDNSIEPVDFNTTVGLR